MYNRSAITTLLLTCPQGGPQQVHNYAKDLKKAWFTFLCSLKRLHSNNTIGSVPRDVRNLIISYTLTNPQLYINRIPLQRLPTFVPVMQKAYKEALIKELCKRHMNKLRFVLTRKCQITKRLNLTPLEVAQARIAHGPRHSIMVKLLDPRQLKNFKKEIKEGYARLLKLK